jgi:hypothetical protein
MKLASGLMAIVFFTTLIASTVLAAPKSTSLDQPSPPPAQSVDASFAALIGERETTVEDEIVALVQKRAEPPAKQPLLELQIDLRVIERALLDRAAGNQDANDRTNLILRQMHLSKAAASLDDFLARTPVTINAAEAAAMKSLHDRTYHLDQLADGSQVDALCAQLGTVLLNLSGPFDPTSVPLMRPGQTQKTSSPATRQADVHSLTLHDCAEEARGATVPPALHKQLVALAAAAENPPANDPDAKMLAQTLFDSVTLLRGLKDLPVSADSRDHIQTMLADGLTLLVDVRTRSAAQQRLQGLAPFRNTVARIGHLSLPKDVSDALAPALAWAAQNDKEGPAVLAAVGKYLENISKYDALPHNAAISAVLKKPLADLDQAFADARATFIDDAGHLNHPAAGGDVFTASPQQQLDLDIDDMARIVDSQSMIFKIPAAVEAIEAIKPHGIALDHRAIAAATALASTNKLLNTTESQRFLQDLIRLADVATSLKSLHAAEIPPAIIETYAAGTLTKFETRWRLLLTDQSNSLAAGAALDKIKMAKLDIAVALATALQQAAGAQSASANSAILARWADWQITSAEIDQALDPYRTATSTAFVAYSTDDTAGVEVWMKLHRRYRPLLELFSDASTHTDACKALPAGLQGDAATLVTPVQSEPFAGARRTSVELAVWARLTGLSDPASADAVLDDLSKGLRK